MLAEKPINLEKVEPKFLDREILRLAIIAELDAVTLYEQLAATTTDKAIREVLLDVAREEKTHVGEFQTLLLRIDEEQVEELKHGKEEIEEELGL
jgi:rubrerythrin